MKKILAMLLALAALLVMSTAAMAADLALVTDVGTIDDESFNQACWEGVKQYAEEHNMTYAYYQPIEDSTDARINSISDAVDDGAKVIVLPGYLFGEAAATVQELFPEVYFIANDVSAGDLGTEPMANLACSVFGEEQAGYLAGYAVVKDGYTKLGFLGGMAVPAVQRFGYGFVQGAAKAADEMGVSIKINYTYGGQFYGDANITAKMEGWYSTGTELVFACGGGIYTSAVEAALNHKGMVVGVDVDQHYIGEQYVETFGYNPFVTSAMKGLANATMDCIDKALVGGWEEIGGSFRVLDLFSGDFVGLPTVEKSWCFKTFTVEEYEAVIAAIRSGEAVVSNDISAMPAVGANVTINMFE